MNAPVLDTLRCAQTLKAAGVPDAQAEATAQFLGDALADVATKEDLNATKKDLDDAIKGLEAKIGHVDESLRAEMNAGFAALRAEMDARFASVRTDMNAGFATLNAKYDILETKLEERSEATANQFKHLTRLIYIMLVAMLALIFESSVGPLLTWGNAPTPTTTEATTPTPESQTPNPTRAPD